MRFHTNEAELGFTQLSELLPIPGIDIVGPLSPDVQQITVFSVGLNIRASRPKEATSLIKFLTAPAAHSIIRRNGMEPV